MAQTTSGDFDFKKLEPHKVLEAAEAAGFKPTGDVYQLNSYENRVFHLKLEDHPDVIVKFYRPQRWSLEAIQQEHDFLWELKDEGLPAVAPLRWDKKNTLLIHEGFKVTFFPRVLGRMPQEFIGDDLKKVGRLLAHIHNIGARTQAKHRPQMDTSYYGGWSTLDFLQNWIAPELIGRYNSAAENILSSLDSLQPQKEFIRIHGDCHRGNLLHNGDAFMIVDFDDFCNGPVIQDYWMLVSGDQDMAQEEATLFLDGYEELREFPHHQLEWIPIYRGLRIISYAGWIARRWQDPSFPRLFPEFNTHKYWAEELENLEKIAWSL